MAIFSEKGNPVRSDNFDQYSVIAGKWHVIECKLVLFSSLIGICIQAFSWYQNQWPWMT